MDLAGAASAPFGRPLVSTAQEIYQHLSPTPTWPEPHAAGGRTMRSLPYVTLRPTPDDGRTIRSSPYVRYHRCVRIGHSDSPDHACYKSRVRFACVGSCGSESVSSHNKVDVLTLGEPGVKSRLGLSSKDTMNRGPFGSTVCAWDIQSRADRFEVSDELNSCAATFGAVQELQLVCHGDFFTFVAGDDRTAEPNTIPQSGSRLDPDLDAHFAHYSQDKPKC